MEYRYQSKDGRLNFAPIKMKGLTLDTDLIDSYLNGPRTLSNDRLSFLIISQPEDKDGSLLSPPPTPTSQESVSECHIQDYELLICATHFLGDGMALHNFANDFFGLLGGPKSENELEAVLQHEWKRQWGNDNDCVRLLFTSNPLVMLTRCTTGYGPPQRNGRPISTITRRKLPPSRFSRGLSEQSRQADCESNLTVF